ncbi:ABC transporter ATP-binding protein [Paenibacillus sp. FSL H8-0548]|uniref:ABC transporter ATP-binding protein n=1 Tax=Paenibacillus sp. FSL H8-0548 TaxID=1920422 RepID=UPI00096EB78D|nr:ABC transporter ATP-binding protein [Paenibacillus sp. FSL H8-0548]OMF34727.1 ABC transporter ATP-binding protein [Paenibacillus sp. FSL H8-0548]
MTALLQVKGLSKSFGSVKAVSGIDFEIKEGHCVALLGPNGAGKTTTIRMITGLLKQTAGEMDFQGSAQGIDHRELIGYLPQSPSFYSWMTGLEYVVYAGKLCGLSSAAAKQRAKELLERVGISSAAKRRISSYSGGMKQRLGLAQALVHQPKLLVMDEPVSALDPLGRREVMKLLRELKQETTVLFSTHVLHDAEELCDDVIIIRNGQVAIQGAIEDIRAEHRKPIIELQLENDEHSQRWLASYMEKIQVSINEGGGASLFHEMELQSGAARFTVHDVDTARRMLLEELTRENVKVSRLEIGHTSLEDLFMKVVTA